MVLNKQSLFRMLFISSLLLPQLPPVFGRSEFHINIFVLIFSLLIFLRYPILSKRRSIIPLGYYLSFQILLICSYWFGSEDFGGLSDIPSYYRPVMLMIITLAFLVLMTDYKSVYQTTIKNIKILVIAIFSYSLLEVFAFDFFSNIFHFLYRLQDKSNIDGVAVSFFTLPYYSAYILNVFLVFLLSNNRVEKSFGNSVYILVCIFSIFLAQSKMGIALCFASVFIFYFMQSKTLNKIFVLTLFFVFMFSLYLYLYDFVSFMRKEYGGHLYHTVYVLLTNPEQSGNLFERINDIQVTYGLIEHNNYFFGVGLGKGQTIETWIASLLYRYGIFGLFFFILIYISIGLYCWYLSSKEEDLYRSELLKICSIWAITIFISQLSGYMMEVTKCAVVTCFMLSLVTFSLNKNDANNFTQEREV